MSASPPAAVGAALLTMLAVAPPALAQDSAPVGVLCRDYVPRVLRI